MFSTGDSSGDGLSGRNQFASIGGPIDWAAMAQQWIQMHDTGNFKSMPDAPPPPNISGTIHAMNMKSSDSTLLSTTTATKKLFDEKGEADMDMDEGEENARCRDTLPPPAPSMRPEESKEQVVMQLQKPWYMQQQNPAVNLPVSGNLAGIVNQAPIASPQWGASVWPPQINLPPPAAGSILNVPLNTAQSTAAHIPSLLKLNVPNPNNNKTMISNVEEQTPDASLVDARKRKMLPAWIREGLEKMEREKQRQLEREQSKTQENAKPSDISSSLTGSVGRVDFPVDMVNIKYNQYSENEKAGDEDGREGDDVEIVAISPDVLKFPLKRTHEHDGSGADDDTNSENTNEPPSIVGNRSYEDRLSDLMIEVRRTLTELLLEVTNEEIANLAQEAVNTNKAKASSAQVIRKSALSSITGKLGLAAYDDSTGDESNDSDNEPYSDSDENNQSEEEIKASIRTKRRAFARITNEIEERIAANAEREEQKLKYYTMLEQKEREHEQQTEVKGNEFGRNEDNPLPCASTSSMTSTISKPYEKDFGETTETKLQHSNGKRQKDRNSRKERTTRFSDNKDSKSAAAVAATYINSVASNPSGTTLFPITATSANISSGMIPSVSTSLEVSQTTTYNIANSASTDDSDNITALNKSLLTAAEAAFEKAAKSQHASSSRSSKSRSDRERSYHGRYYDHRDEKSDRYRLSECKRDSKGRQRENDIRHNSRERKNKNIRSSEKDDTAAVDRNEKHDEETSSSDTDTSSSSSTSTSSNSHHSSHYSRTSTTSKQRHVHKYSQRERNDERKGRDRRSERSRSRSRSRQRSHYRHPRSRSYRYSSDEDDYDNNNRYRHSSSRHGSARKRSRSRSRSTYSSSSHRRRH